MSTTRTSLLAAGLCLALAVPAMAQSSGGAGGAGGSGGAGGTGSAAGSATGGGSAGPSGTTSPSSAPALNAPAGNPALVDPSAAMPDPGGLGVAPPANPMNAPDANTPGTAGGPATGGLPGSAAQRGTPAARRNAPLPSCATPDCGTPSIMAPP